MHVYLNIDLIEYNYILENRNKNNTYILFIHNIPKMTLSLVH